MDIVLQNPLVWAIPILFVLLVIELVYSKLIGDKKLYYWKDLITSTIMSVGAAMLQPIIKLVTSAAIFYMLYNHFNIEINEVHYNLMGYESFGWNWYVWLSCLFATQFGQYWLHRLNHTVRILWAAHLVHHSSEHFNFGTALRLSWVAMIYKPLFYAWLPIIGFHPEMVLFCMAVESIYQFFIHSAYCPKLGRLNLIFVTPKLHAVHHAKNLKYLDKNHAAIFSFYDRIFGTFQEFDDRIKIEFGLTSKVNSLNPIDITTYEFKRLVRDVAKAKNLGIALKYIFGPPGWSPDKSTLTVRELQAKA